MKIRKSNVNGLGRPSTLLAVLTAASQFSGALGLTLNLCSSQNTGSASTPDVTIYQSLGNCQTKCSATFAFAVVQGENCWCSNYAPGSTVDITDCNTSCPGYPYEQCGSTPNNLFGYLALNIAPSGTINPQTAVTPSTTPSVAATTTVSTTPLASTGFSSLTSLTQPSKVTTSTTTLQTIDVTVTAEDSGSTATPTSTAAGTYTSQQLYTSGGTVITSYITVVPTATSAPETGGTSKKMSSGSIIAIAVASVVAAVVLFAALIVGFCCWRRKVERSYTPEAPGVSNTPKRTTSILSKSGLLGTPATSSNTEGQPVIERRSSRPMVFDQRLNPNAIMTHEDSSRTSIVSMQDNRDYTRTLNVRNPDPTE